MRSIENGNLFQIVNLPQHQSKNAHNVEIQRRRIITVQVDVNAGTKNAWRVISRAASSLIDAPVAEEVTYLQKHVAHLQVAL